MSGILKNILRPKFKHKKLSEDLASLEQSLQADGVSFACRELGSTFVTEAQDESTTADAIRRIVHAARMSNLKLRKVTLHITTSGLKIQCAETGETVLDTDIYNVTYCSADSHYNHVFAFITTVDKNAYECHAYLCNSAKAARRVSFAIAQSFKLLAYRLSPYDLSQSLYLCEEAVPDEFVDIAKNTNRLIESFQSLTVNEDRESDSIPGSNVPNSESSSTEKSDELSLQISNGQLKLKSPENSNSIRKNWAAFEQDTSLFSEDRSFQNFGDYTLRSPGECPQPSTAPSESGFSKKVEIQNTSESSDSLKSPLEKAPAKGSPQDNVLIRGSPQDRISVRESSTFEGYAINKCFNSFNDNSLNSFESYSIGHNSKSLNSLEPHSIADNSIGSNSIGHNSKGPNSIGDNSIGSNSIGHNSKGPNSIGYNSIGSNSIGHNSKGPNSIGLNIIEHISIEHKSLGFSSNDLVGKNDIWGKQNKSQWETFGNTSPLSSFDEMWESSSSNKSFNANSNWTSFTD
ncbi:UNVERIFIED_CONTAM: hypothetical protein RMT77_013372 [Armadillidium vulgare]